MTLVYYSLMSPPRESELPTSVRPSDFPPIVKVLGGYLASAGIPAYLVGGVVRDVVLGRETTDVDMAIAHDTREVGAALANHFGGHSTTLDEERGIVRVVVPGKENTPVIDLTPIHDGILEDLSRRDFTLDAMAVSTSEASNARTEVHLIDPYNGTEDLRDRSVKAVSPSVFTDDAARLMRGPRLAAELGFSLSDKTAESIRSHAHLLPTVAQERVRDELLKILAAPSASSSLRLLDELGLLPLAIPELALARGVTQPKEHHWDVFTHCIETAGQVERLLAPIDSEASPFDAHLAPDFPSMAEYFSQAGSDGHSRLTLLKLAALLHDIAKPTTKTVEPSGRIRFLGHHQMGAQMSVEILGRLRLSRRGIELVSSMVLHHLRPSQMAPNGQLPTPRAIYRYYRDVGDAAIDTLYLNLADYLAARGPHLCKQEWIAHCRVVGHILREGLAPKRSEHRPKLIDGHDVIRTFAVAPGPTVGVMLELVREAQASGDICTREEAMQLVEISLSAGGHSA